jgi:hypothetical protein
MKIAVTETDSVPLLLVGRSLLSPESAEPSKAVR